MRQGKFVVAASLLAVSLLGVPIWAGSETGVGNDLSQDRLSQKTAQTGGQHLVPSLELETIPEFEVVGPQPQALVDLDLVWDNGFTDTPFGFIFADQCASIYCGVYPPGVDAESNDPLSFLGNDIFLPAGTIVSGARMRFTFRNPAVAQEIEGLTVTFWENDDGGTPLNPDDDFPLNTYTEADILDPNVFPIRFAIEIDDPGFQFIDEGGINRRVDAEFNPGDQFVANGDKLWITLTPAQDFPPQLFTFMAEGPLFQPAVQAFLPPNGAAPWQQTPPTDPVAEFLNQDSQFQLFGQRPNGGSTVVRASGTVSCNPLDIVITNTTIADCAAGAGTNSDAIGGAASPCDFSVDTSGDTTPADVMASIAATGGGTLSCGGVTVTLQSSGEFLIVSTDDGPLPQLLVSSGGLFEAVGGPANCVTLECGLQWQVGLQSGEVLPEIAGGLDNYRTVDECDEADPIADDIGTWREYTFGTSLFDRPGLASATSVTSPHGGDLTLGAPVALSGVGRIYYNDDADFIVERKDVARFGECTCDFASDAGSGTTLSPDGVCDADDETSFNACVVAQTADCLAVFDYDRDGTVGSAQDIDVFDCLRASSDNHDCCPPTFNGNPADPNNYPRTANEIELELRRMQLRSCGPIEVVRDGFPESWWLHHYLSAVPARVGAGELGDCTGNLESEPNNVLASATDLGFIARGNPVRFEGALSSTTCDPVGALQAGQSDPDVYTFEVGFSDLISIAVRGRANAETCDGVGGNCVCDTNDLAVTSVWLFDESGLSLLASDDPGVPACDSNSGTCDPDTVNCDVCSAPGCCCCSPIVGQTTDPSVERVLAPGKYTVVVGSAAQIQVVNPVDADSCAVGGTSAGGVEPNDGEGPTTGNYEINVGINDRSTMEITQENATGGTFEQRLLIQSLTTLARTGDPFATIAIDTGELGEDADILGASGTWTNSNSVSGIFPGDEDFVPGVSADGTAVVEIQQADDVVPTVVHRIEPPTLRDCPIIEGQCAFIQNPNDADLDAMGAAQNDTQFFPLADDFTLASDATIRSLTVWVTGAGDAALDQEYDVVFYNDGTVTGGCAGPDTVVKKYDNIVPGVIRSTELNDADRVTFNLGVDANEDGEIDSTEVDPVVLAAGTYWLEIVWDSREGTGAQPFFQRSDEGDGSMYRNLGAIEADPVDDDENCPDFDLEGDPAAVPNDYDCTAFVDVPETTECNEAACGNGTEVPECAGSAFPGDLFPADLAFCLGTQTVDRFTKDLPFDVAAGDWRATDGVTIWHQGSAGGDTGVGDLSDLNAPSTLNLGQETADDFTFFEDVTIEGVRWTGRYNTNTPETQIFPRVPGNDDRFEVIFYDDFAGEARPGTPLKIYARPQPTGRTAGEFTTFGSGADGFIEYEYVLDISGDPFEAAANTTYWLSVVNDLRGSAFTWFWAEADTGDINGRSAVRELADDWTSGSVAGDDHAFDLLVTGTTVAYAAKSVDCTAAAHTATGLGYYLDPNQVYINGFQVKVAGGAGISDTESDENRWRGVKAPWKAFADVDGLSFDPTTDETGIKNAFDAAGISITDAVYDCLVEGLTSSETIIGVYGGTAAFDIDAERFGIDVGGRIDRQCNEQIIDVAFDPSEVLDERLDLRGLRISGSNLTRAVATPIDAPECFDDFECFPRPNVCWTPVCNAGTCGEVARPYGDANEDGVKNIFDIFCMLDVIAGTPGTCNKEQADIQPCAGNGVVSILDVFAVLDAIGGIDPCCNPPPPPAPGVFASDASIARAPRGTAPVQIKIVPETRTAQPGDTVKFNVYASGANSVRGYEIWGVVDGLRRGSASVTASIENRRDGLMSGIETVSAINQSSNRIVVASISGSVSADRTAYLGTFTVTISDDAVGTLTVDLATGAEQLVVGEDGSGVYNVTPGSVRITN